MKNLIINIAACVFLLSNIMPSAADNLPTNSTARVNYQAVAAQINKLIAQAASVTNELAKIDAEGKNPNSPIYDTNRSDWRQIRYQTAFNVLTNLSLFEDVINKSETAGNFPFTVPTVHAPIMGNTVLGPVTNAADRQLLAEYKTALQASSKLSYCRRDWIAERDQYAESTLNFIADAYSRPPTNNMEIQKLLTAFSNTDCAMQFSNRLFKAKKSP